MLGGVVYVALIAGHRSLIGVPACPIGRKIIAWNQVRYVAVRVGP
jgi:hypothetical protein